MNRAILKSIRSLIGKKGSFWSIKYGLIFSRFLSSKMKSTAEFWSLRRIYSWEAFMLLNTITILLVLENAGVNKLVIILLSWCSDWSIDLDSRILCPSNAITMSGVRPAGNFLFFNYCFPHSCYLSSFTFNHFSPNQFLIISFLTIQLYHLQLLLIHTVK